MSSLTVVVPATDTPPTLAACVAALDASTHPPEELIVVDRPASLSASEARNAGAGRARGDVLVFVDADVEVHPSALERIRAAFDADPELTAIHGSYDDRPSERSTVSTFRNLLHHHVHQAGAGPSTTFWSGLGAVRRDAFTAAGGFDGTRYPHPSIEDIELGHRLGAAGGRLRLDPSIQGTHRKRWTLRSMLWTDFARRGVPWVALQVRTRTVSSSLNCGWPHRLSALACLLAAAGLVLLQPLVVLASVAALLVLNRAFYAFLTRRLGPLRAAACVPLHALHHLVSVLAVPAGIAVAAVAALRSDAPAPVAELEPAPASAP